MAAEAEAAREARAKVRLEGDIYCNYNYFWNNSILIEWDICKHGPSQTPVLTSFTNWILIFNPSRPMTWQLGSRVRYRQICFLHFHTPSILYIFHSPELFLLKYSIAQSVSPGPVWWLRDSNTNRIPINLLTNFDTWRSNTQTPIWIYDNTRMYKKFLD